MRLRALAASAVILLSLVYISTGSEQAYGSRSPYRYRFPTPEVLPFRGPTASLKVLPAVWVEYHGYIAPHGINTDLALELNHWEDTQSKVDPPDPPPPPPPAPVRTVARVTPSPRPPTPVTVGVEAWRTLVTTYFAPEHVELALRIIQCESGGNPSAKNPRSTASGLFQHLASAWDGRSAKAGWGGSINLGWRSQHCRCRLVGL